MHHPWRRFRALVDWRLVWADMPDGTIGETDFEAGTVTLSHDLSQAQRRCTIAHETEHVVRGPVPLYLVPREERDVDRNVARLLLPDIRQMGEALAWAHGLDEAAEELWVDTDTLRARLEHLHPAERAWLRGRLQADDGHP
jgi:hypothetical protein